MEIISFHVFVRFAAPLRRTRYDAGVHFDQEEEEKVVPADVLLGSFGHFRLLSHQGGLCVQKDQKLGSVSDMAIFLLMYMNRLSAVGPETHLPGERGERDLISASDFGELGEYCVVFYSENILSVGVLFVGAVETGL